MVYGQADVRPVCYLYRLVVVAKLRLKNLRVIRVPYEPVFRPLTRCGTDGGVIDAVSLNQNLIGVRPDWAVLGVTVFDRDSIQFSEVLVLFKVPSTLKGIPDVRIGPPNGD